MYCPVCGAESTQGLKYCKRCGTSLSDPGDDAPKKLPNSLTAAFLFVIGGITLVGLVAPIAAADTLTKDFSTREMMALIFGSWVVTLIFDAMLIWLLLRLLNVPYRFAATAGPERMFPEARIPVQVAGPDEPLASVTEHTTRNFEAARHREVEGRTESH